MGGDSLTIAHNSNLWTSTILFHQAIINGDINAAGNRFGTIDATAIKLTYDGMVDLERDTAINLFISCTRYHAKMASIDVAMRIVLIGPCIDIIDT